MERIVVDTNVFVSALLSPSGNCRGVLRLCLLRRCQPLMGEKLFHEFCDVVQRPVMARSPLSEWERQELLEAFFSVCEWVQVFFLWRPNLTDEGDNHLMEMAVAGMAGCIVTQNARHFRGGELHFPEVRVETPSGFQQRWRRDYGDDDNSDS
jgi:putative PIN family toxin of toxin-antitoxin system